MVIEAERGTMFLETFSVRQTGQLAKPLAKTQQGRGSRTVGQHDSGTVRQWGSSVPNVLYALPWRVFLDTQLNEERPYCIFSLSACP